MRYIIINYKLSIFFIKFWNIIFLYIFSIWAIFEGWGAWNAVNIIRGLSHLSSRHAANRAEIKGARSCRCSKLTRCCNAWSWSLHLIQGFRRTSGPLNRLKLILLIPLATRARPGPWHDVAVDVTDPASWASRPKQRPSPRPACCMVHRVLVWRVALDVSLPPHPPAAGKES